jgi:hypothetical protein
MLVLSVEWVLLADVADVLAGFLGLVEMLFSGAV